MVYDQSFVVLNVEGKLYHSMKREIDNQLFLKSLVDHIKTS